MSEQEVVVAGESYYSEASPLRSPEKAKAGWARHSKANGNEGNGLPTAHKYVTGHVKHHSSQEPSSYVSSPLDPNSNPERSVFVPSSVDPRRQTQSPVQPQRLAHETESEAGSLNVRFGQSNLGGDRHGPQSASHTQRSTTSLKRTTDEMQGSNSTTQPDARPTKQPYSPNAPRGAQTLNVNPPIQTHAQPRRNEPHTPAYLASTIVGHYSNVGDAPVEAASVPYPSKQNQSSPPSSPLSTVAPETVLMKQPVTRPITEQQLINEVKGIYAGLVMVEKKCVDIIDQQNKSTKRLTDQQWKALVALHRTLLQEHHDFFSASQHPTASDSLKKLAIKYAMPARMWRHGIHAFLELLRHRLPDSMDHMLSFIYLAYSMMALLKESVPSFVETWIECLGDLARYRMAIEDSDPRDREVWSNVAKMWYNEAADKSPTVGRIQHHLAVLARPNIIEQLFYYDKALVSIVPFVNARESIMLLFDMFLKNNEAVQSRYPPAEYAFVYYYALMFTRQHPAEGRKVLELFKSSISGHIDRAGPRYKTQGPEIASAVFSGLLDFGKDDSLICDLYTQHREACETQKKKAGAISAASVPSDAEINRTKQREYWENITNQTSVERVSFSDQLFDQDTISRSSDVVALGALMAREAISAVSSRMGDRNITPFMHVTLANLWDMSFVAGALTYVEAYIPWGAIALFLNTVGRSLVSFVNVEAEEFPITHGGPGRQLPEDFLMRGMKTTRHYHPVGFFTGPLVDEDERTIELPSHQAPRVERCLWLGIRLAQLGRYLVYDAQNKTFGVTEFAKSLAAQYV